MKAFVKGDIDGFIALWLDNLVVAIVMVKLSLGFPSTWTRTCSIRGSCPRRPSGS
jgi:hypothetical protein